jgi:hypothetical protein
MNAREVLLLPKVSAGRIAPRTLLQNVAINSRFETKRARFIGKLMALKPANGAQGE